MTELTKREREFLECCAPYDGKTIKRVVSGNLYLIEHSMFHSDAISIDSSLFAFVKPGEEVYIKRLLWVEDEPDEPISNNRRHGHWVDDDGEFGYYANCSVCGYEMDVHENRGYFNFCPHCGSDMS